MSEQDEFKKVCFIVPEFSLDTHFRYVAEMVEALAHNHNIFLVIEKGNIPVCTSVSSMYKQKFNCPLFRVLEMLWVIVKARIQGYKNIYVHYSFVGAFCASAVIRLMGGKVFYWNAGLPWQYKRSWYREFAEEITYKMVTHLVTATTTLQRDYAKFYHLCESSIKVVPNWINIQLFERRSLMEQIKLKNKLGIGIGVKVLLFVHRLAKRKGAHLLPKILDRLQNENVVMVIVGEGPEKENMMREFHFLGLQEKIRVVGPVPNMEIVQYFSIADIFIMPSEEEGFPHVLLESMAAQVPFVASDVGGVKDMVSPLAQQFVYPSYGIAGFVEGVKKLLIDKKLYTELQIDAQIWVQNYSKEKVLRQFSDLF